MEPRRGCSGSRMETGSSSRRNEKEAGGVVGNGDEEKASKQQSSKDKVCFIHSARLLETMDSNPRYTGRVRATTSISN